MSPPTCQLVNLFSPTPNDTHSGRTTPSSLGGATRGRSSPLTVDSNATGARSFDMQTEVMIHPNPRQRSFSVADPDVLAVRKPSGKEKGSPA
jgi:hypothetical protein